MFLNFVLFCEILRILCFLFVVFLHSVYSVCSVDLNESFVSFEITLIDKHDVA